MFNYKMVQYITVTVSVFSFSEISPAFFCTKGSSVESIKRIYFYVFCWCFLVLCNPLVVGSVSRAYQFLDSR